MEIEDAAFLDIGRRFLNQCGQSGFDLAAVLNCGETESDAAAGRSHAQNDKLTCVVGVFRVGKIVELVTAEIFVADAD